MIRLRDAIGLVLLEAEYVTGRDCRKMSLPKLRWFVARDSARRASDRAFLAQVAGLAACAPQSKKAGEALTEIIAECLWFSDADPEPQTMQQLEADFSAVFGSLGIPASN